MNQKDRILELVDKGIISAEEAVVLLEKMGEKASAKEQPTSSQLDSVMEGVASAFTKFSAKSDQTDDAIQVVLKRAKEIDRRIDEIRTAEQLDSLTVDEEMELVRLQEEAEQLNNQYKSLLQEKKQADAKVKAEKKQEWEEKTRRTAGNLASWAAKFAESVVTVAKTAVQSVEINSPYMQAKNGKKVPYHFHQVIDEASILDFKIANGILRVKTVPGNTMTIEGNCRVATQDEEFFDAEAFIRDRVKVGVDEDTIYVKSLSKRVYCDWTISLPQKVYDYVAMKGLNTTLHLKELEGKDYYFEVDNGDIRLKDVKGVLLEAETVNGNLKYEHLEFKDIVSETVNGNIHLDGKFLGTKLEAVTGNIKVAVAHPETKKVDVETVNGNIKIEVAEEVGLEAEIETSLGSIHFDETVFEVIRQTKDLSERSALIRKTRDSMTRVVAETTTGNIQVNQLQSDTSSKKEG